MYQNLDITYLKKINFFYKVQRFDIYFLYKNMNKNCYFG